MSNLRDEGPSLIERAAMHQAKMANEVLVTKAMPTNMEKMLSFPVTEIPESREKVQEVVVPFPSQRVFTEDDRPGQARAQLSIIADRVVTFFGSTSLHSKKTGFDSRGTANVFKYLVLLDEEKVAVAVKESEFAYSREYFELVKTYRQARDTLINLSGDSRLVDEALDELIEKCVASVEKRRSIKGRDTSKLLSTPMRGKKPSRWLRGVTKSRVYIGFFTFLFLCLLIAMYSTLRVEPLKEDKKPYAMPNQKEIIEYRPSPPLSPASALYLGIK
jgi:hypothetical protein